MRASRATSAGGTVVRPQPHCVIQADPPVASRCPRAVPDRRALSPTGGRGKPRSTRSTEAALIKVRPARSFGRAQVRNSAPNAAADRSASAANPGCTASAFVDQNNAGLQDADDRHLLQCQRRLARRRAAVVTLRTPGHPARPERCCRSSRADSSRRTAPRRPRRRTPRRPRAGGPRRRPCSDWRSR